MTRPETTTTVLVVDDQSMVRDIVSEMLTDAAYQTIEAADAEEALVVLDEHPEIDVVITDVSMPGLRNGCSLAHEIRKRRPNIAVILTSGKGMPNIGDMPEGVSFISKPYTENAILDVVREGAAHR